MPSRFLKLNTLCSLQNQQLGFLQVDRECQLLSGRIAEKCIEITRTAPVKNFLVKEILPGGRELVYLDDCGERFDRRLRTRVPVECRGIPDPVETSSVRGIVHRLPDDIVAEEP